jgi:hypothetical protein
MLVTFFYADMFQILALRKPYMPQKHSGYHVMPPGPERLIDICFRQLRYDSTDAIVDTCYHAIQQLVKSSYPESFGEYQFEQETPRGTRYPLLRNAKVEELIFHDSKGAIARISFDCPRKLQQRAMHFSGLFEEGMLCCLIGYDEKLRHVNVTFLEVFLRESSVRLLDAALGWVLTIIHSMP